MKICTAFHTQKPPTPAIVGHIYQRIKDPRKLYLMTKHSRTGNYCLFGLESGGNWSDKDIWGDPEPEGWIDVTDKYCLREI